MTTEIERKRKANVISLEPKFRNPDEMTVEELTDPDYRLKQLMKDNGVQPLTCSKCHHCRR